MKPRIKGPSSSSGKIEAPRLVQISRYYTGISNQSFSLKYLLSFHGYTMLILDGDG